jgi:hypothetical protein
MPPISSELPELRFIRTTFILSAQVEADYHGESSHISPPILKNAENFGDIYHLLRLKPMNPKRGLGSLQRKRIKRESAIMGRKLSIVVHRGATW